MRQRIVIGALVAVFAISASFVQAQAVPVEGLPGPELYKMTNVQLDSFLRSNPYPGLPVGERVAAYAKKYIGSEHVGQPKSDDLSSVATTTVALRAVALAYSRNWTEYYAFSTRERFKSFVPRNFETAHWYPVDLAETADWALESVSFPDVDRVAYRYKGYADWQKHQNKVFKLNRPDPTEDKIEEKFFARYNQRNVSLLKTGDLFFGMVRFDDTAFKDTVVGTIIVEGGVPRIISNQGNSKYIALENLPGSEALMDPTEGLRDLKPGEPLDFRVRWMIVYRPRELSRETLDQLLSQFKATTPMIPDPESIDGLKTGAVKRRSTYFNVSGFKWFKRIPADLNAATLYQDVSDGPGWSGEVSRSSTSESKLTVGNRSDRTIVPAVGTDAKPLILKFRAYVDEVGAGKEFMGGLAGKEESALIGFSSKSENNWKGDRFQVVYGAAVLTGSEPDSWAASRMTGWTDFGIMATSTMVNYYVNGRLIQTVHRPVKTEFDRIVFKSGGSVKLDSLTIAGN